MTKHSRMSDWTMMAGDMNWADYDCSWGRKLRDGVWFVLRFENMDEACGRDNEGHDTYLCDVLEVDLTSLSENNLKSALTYCGFSFDNEGNIVNEYSGEPIAMRGDDIYEIVLTECCVSYGCYAPLDSVSGNSYPERVRAAARRLADELMQNEASLEDKLQSPVNALGSTAREYMQGDFQSAMDRALNPPVRVKQVKQKSLSAECWSVQVWGTGYCETCEYKGTEECGGQEILKTGKNEKGIKVTEHGFDKDSELGL